MKNNGLGYLYLLNTVILFSTYEVVSKTLVGRMDPFQINFIRFFMGGLILLFFMLFTGDIKISKKDFLWVTLLGAINVVFSMSFMQLSLNVENAKASVAAVIFSSNPIFVFIFSAIINKEKIERYKILGFLAGLGGIMIIFLEKLDIKSLNFKSPLFAFISAVLYGLYTVIGRKVSVRIGSLKMNSYSFILGSLMLLPVLLYQGAPVIKFEISAIYQIAYLSIFVTGLAYLTYFKGLSIVGASSGSLVFFIKPALASAIAVIFLNEKSSFNLVAGTAFIILGIVIIIYWKNIKESICKIK